MRSHIQAIGKSAFNQAITAKQIPAERLSANRWVWLVLIVALSFIGPVAFLAAGRRPAPVTEPPPGKRPAAGAGTADVVAALYGDDRR